MKVCIAGNRGGHIGCVLNGLEQLTDVKLAGLCAVAEEDKITGIQDWCDKNGHTPEIFDDYKEMLDVVKPDILVIVGPFQLHAEMCVEAFGRKIHVFCEKPAAITLESLAEIKEAHAKTDVHFATFMGSRYNPAFFTAKRLIEDGQIGTVRLLEARKSYKLGTRAPYYHQRETYGGTIA
ncbi:MAG: Gfo/Idh/MocA family oxidoreductase, partial [Kiritimatiellae bacterium]|nr:Gfo/Idh/MocA family oxidoreductase [Kiritimatiellia bacterium]